MRAGSSVPDMSGHQGWGNHLHQAPAHKAQVHHCFPHCHVLIVLLVLLCIIFVVSSNACHSSCAFLKTACSRCLRLSVLFICSLCT